MNNDYYLPKIKNIKIKNYDLYKCPLKIQFSDKLNVIFGTNGLGKTTLLNIIQYSIIGPYNGKLYFRNYKDQQRVKRPMHVDYFFKNRMQNRNEKAEVEVQFNLGKDFYIVKHSLFENKLLEYSINGNNVLGIAESYEEYEERRRKEKSIEEDLIYKYQESIVKSSNFPNSDAYITMLAETMFFTEKREFIFWDKDLIKTILSQYFMPLEKYLEFTKIQKLVKKFDSQQRLVTYKMSMVKPYLVEKSDETPNDQYELEDLQDVNDEIDSIQKEIMKLDDKIRLIEKDKWQNRIEFENIDKRLMEIETIWYKEIFPNEYQSIFNRYMPSLQSGICPFCGADHVDKKVEIGNCFFCHKPVEVRKEKNLNELEIERKNKEMEKKRLSNNFKSFKDDIDKVKLKKRELQQKLNSFLEKQKEVKKALDIKNNDSYEKYHKLEIEKEDYKRKLAQAKEKEQKLVREIDTDMQEVFLEYSQIFKKYASSFLGLDKKVELRLVGNEGNGLFEFKLNNTIRNTEFELSESQRIFVDMAFRLSILEFLNKSAYFISETPDSTLDYSFESNAIKTFCHFIDSNNTLFISANARNSKLVSQLVKCYKEEVKIVNLLKESSLAGDLLSQVRQFDLYDFLEE